MLEAKAGSYCPGARRCSTAVVVNTPPVSTVLPIAPEKLTEIVATDNKNDRVQNSRNKKT